MCLALNPEQELTLLGVACDGPVRSVYLGVKSDPESVVEHISVMQKISESLVKIKDGSHRHSKESSFASNETNLYDVTPAQLPNIKLSTASTTSVMLTRISTGFGMVLSPTLRPVRLVKSLRTCLLL